MPSPPATARTRKDWISRRWRSESPRSGKHSRNAACCWHARADRIGWSTPPLCSGLRTQHRAALNAGSIGFDAVLESEGLVPAPDLLLHFAHWITPSHQPKRYDTHFFLAKAPREQLAVHDGSEAVESIWITPAQALADTEAGRFKLVFATARNLEKLGRSESVRDAMETARGSTVVTVQPKGTKLEGTKRLLRIPEEAGYGGSEFIVDLLPAS